MAMPGDPPPQDPPPADPPATPVWHAVIDADRRIKDWDFGHTTQAHLTATQAANPGTSIVTVQGDPPNQIGIGDRLAVAGGAVAPPTTAQLLTPEAVAERKERVEQWVVRNGPTRQFLFYAAHIDTENRAKVMAAVMAETFYRTLDHATLSNDTYWGRLNGHAQLEWDEFCRLLHLPSWYPSGSHDLVNNMRNGLAWYTVGVDGMGRYIPVVDPDGANWPATYTFSEVHRNEYVALIKKVQVL